MSPELELSVIDRIAALTRNATMWGSPEELEAVAVHFTHVLLTAKEPEWTIEKTLERWKGPLAGDAEEHEAMRSRMWGAELEKSRVQVVQGFLVVWTGLERNSDREALFGPWIEALLDVPQRAGTPDRLNMILFALMGFVAANPQAYVQALNLERHRIGGHELRPLPVVAPSGPTDAGMTYGRNFKTFPKVIEGIGAMVTTLRGERARGTEN
ncbi:MAG: hypothetical protein JNM17_28705 [Archangium sp.]|nr:hypothetical protein [Archangium sp.]